MNLADMQLGKKAMVSDLANVSDMVRRRLIDLGIMEGCEICLRQKLPFGGPLTIESNGQRIGIRRREAAQIRVEAAC
jgi:ferrous iron transport protein A